VNFHQKKKSFYNELLINRQKWYSLWNRFGGHLEIRTPILEGYDINIKPVCRSVKKSTVVLLYKNWFWENRE